MGPLGTWIQGSSSRPPIGCSPGSLAPPCPPRLRQGPCRPSQALAPSKLPPRLLCASARPYRILCSPSSWSPSLARWMSDIIACFLDSKIPFCPGSAHPLPRLLSYPPPAPASQHSWSLSPSYLSWWGSLGSWHHTPGPGYLSHTRTSECLKPTTSSLPRFGLHLS